MAVPAVPAFQMLPRDTFPPSLPERQKQQPLSRVDRQSQVLSRPPLTVAEHSTMHRAGTTPFSHPMAMQTSSSCLPCSPVVQVVTHQHMHSPQVPVPCKRPWPRHWLALLPCKHRLEHGTAFQLISVFSWGSSGRLWLCNKQVISLHTASYKLILPSV